MRVVILGGGRVGEFLAQVLLQRGNEVSIIEDDEQKADDLSVMLEGRYLVIKGDGCDSRYQEDAGIRNADVFVAVSGEDDDNLVACEVASRVFHVPRVVARVNNPKNLRIFRAVGVECVSSTAYIASLIEEEALMGSMSAASSLMHGNVTLAEIAVPHMRHYSEEEGVSIKAIKLPEDALIVAVSTEDDVEVAQPSTKIHSGDSVIVVADTDILDDVRAVFKGL